jgi:hypothetical protein
MKLVMQTTTTPPQEPQPRAHRRLGRLRVRPLVAPEGANAPTQDAEAPTESGQLTRDEIDAYLTQENRSADSLIAAFSLTHDTNFLYEAADEYPNDPRVQLQVLEVNLFPEARWQWLEAFRQSAPNNSLANYLAARECSKAGDREGVLRELNAATDKPTLDVYWLIGRQRVTEAYISAGYAPADATLAGFETEAGLLLTLSCASEMRALARDLAASAFQYRQNGDAATADALAAAGLLLGERYAAGDTGKLFINELAGMAIQRLFLSQLGSSSAVRVGEATQTVAERIANLEARRTAIRDLLDAVSFGQVVTSGKLDDADLLTYFERVRTEGEFAATQWLRDKLTAGAKPQSSASDRK